MFIYHFNRLIRNRWVWGIFAIVIVIAFVFGDAASGTGKDENRYVGVLNGKKIESKDFDYMQQLVVGLGDRSRRDNRSRDELNKETWERLAVAQLADDLGIEGTGGLVQQQLKAMFDENGVFSWANYQQYLLSLGLNPQTGTKLFERMLGTEIPYGILLGTMAKSVSWASPLEVDAALQTQLDTVTFSTMTFTNPDAEKEITLSDEEISAFYAENMALFEVPERVTVRYISWPLTNFYSEVAVSENDIQLYYEDFQDKFKRVDTNNVPVYLELEEVRDEIIADLQKEKSLEQARDVMRGKATTLALEGGLDALVKELGGEIQPLGPFAITETLTGVENGRQFAEAAFELAPDGILRFGSAMGTANAYFMELVTLEPRHTPALETIKDDVKAKAADEARVKAFEAYAKNVSSELGNLLKTKETTWEIATKAASVHGMNVTTAVTFTAADMRALPEIPHAYPAIATAVTLPEKTVSDPVPVADDTMLLVYVEKREPGDALRAEMMRNQMRAQTGQMYTASIVQGWLAWNLDRMGLKDPTKGTSFGAPAVIQASEDPEFD